MNKLDAAFQLFDDYNKQDPRSFTWEGITYPQEYFLAIKLHQWVLKLDPDAGEELLLASRSQHIGRWEIPREDYPQGREAYLKWRKDMAQHHARIVAELMAKAGYNDEQVERVQQIILKKRIKADAEVQIMENAVCLVFLEFQYEDFRKRYVNDPEKMIDILRKSLLKMDAHGHSFALQLPYSEGGQELVQKAVERITK